MQVKEIVKEYGLQDRGNFEQFIKSSGLPTTQTRNGLEIADDVNVKDLIKFYFIWKDEEPVRQEARKKEIEREKQEAQEEAQKEALFWKISRQEAATEMILSTCQQIDGYRATKQLGLVFGEVIFKSNVFRSMKSGMDDFFAKHSPFSQELKGSSKLIANARQYAMNKMKADASRRKANAIIGIDSESSIEEGGLVHVSIFGTAVYLEKIE